MNPDRAFGWSIRSAITAAELFGRAIGWCDPEHCFVENFYRHGASLPICAR
jgi:hypothetical protein